MKRNGKTRKIFLAVAAVICLCVALTACGGKKPEETKSGTATPASVPETVPESLPAADTKNEEVKEEKVTEEIPFEVQEAYSEAMLSGESTITQAGVNGQKEVTYKVTYVDGKEVNREVVKETVTTEPVAQIITYGTGQAAPPQGDAGGKTVVSREAFYSCKDGSLDYYEIIYSDGTKAYELPDGTIQEQQ